MPELSRSRSKICRYLAVWGSLFLFTALCTGTALSATLVWDLVPGAKGYRVYWGTAQGSYPNNVNAGGATQYSLDRLPLADNTMYYITVTAYNSAGESGYATPVGYSPGDNTPPLPPKNPWVE